MGMICSQGMGWFGQLYGTIPLDLRVQRGCGLPSYGLRQPNPLLYVVPTDNAVREQSQDQQESREGEASLDQRQLVPFRLAPLRSLIDAYV